MSPLNQRVPIKMGGATSVGGARDAAQIHSAQKGPHREQPDCVSVCVEGAALNMLGFSFCHSHSGPMGGNHSEEKSDKGSSGSVLQKAVTLLAHRLKVSLKWATKFVD